MFIRSVDVEPDREGKAKEKHEIFKSKVWKHAAQYWVYLFIAHLFNDYGQAAKNHYIEFAINKILTILQFCAFFFRNFHVHLFISLFKADPPQSQACQTGKKKRRIKSPQTFEKFNELEISTHNWNTNHLIFDFSIYRFIAVFSKRMKSDKFLLHTHCKVIKMFDSIFGATEATPYWNVSCDARTDRKKGRQRARARARQRGMCSVMNRKWFFLIYVWLISTMMQQKSKYFFPKYTDWLEPQIDWG